MGKTEKVDLSNVAFEILPPNVATYSWTLCLVPQTWDTEYHRWRGIPSYGDIQHLDGLQLRCYQNPEQPERECYSWYAEYTERYSIGLDDAERMYKTLSSVTKGLEKAREHDGTCTTFGHYALRVARALGIKTFIRPSKWGEGEYQRLTLAEGQYAIDNVIWDFRNNAKDKASAAD